MHQSPSSTTADYLWGVTPQEGVRLSIAYDTRYGFDSENWTCEFTQARWVTPNGSTVAVDEIESHTWCDAAYHAYRNSDEFEREIRQACREHWAVRQQWLRLCQSGPVDGSCEVEGMPERRSA